MNAYEFVGKKGHMYNYGPDDIKENSNCSASEKTGKGPGSCGGDESSNSVSTLDEVNSKLSSLESEQKALFAKEKMLWETSKSHLSANEFNRLEEISPQVHDLKIMRDGIIAGHPDIARSIIREGDAAKQLRNNPGPKYKSTPAEKARQWRRDHPL